MSETMRLVAEKSGELCLLEVPIPTVSEPLDAVIKVSSALIERIDIEVAMRKANDGPHGVGHAACGEVIDVGSEVNSFRIGDIVVVNAVMPCFICNDCQRGNTYYCKNTNEQSTLGGCMSEYLYINNAEVNLAHVPPGISEENACYAPQIMSGGFNAVEATVLPTGGYIAIFGLEATGLMAVMGAQLSCSGLIIAVGRKNHEELRFAKEFGADISLSFEEDIEKQIHEITKGQGLDAAVECTGNNKSLVHCINCTRTGGTISKSGIYYSGKKVLSDECLSVEQLTTIRLTPSIVGGERVERMLRLIDSGKVDPSKLTTHRIDFLEIDTLRDRLHGAEQGFGVNLVEF